MVISDAEKDSEFAAYRNDARKAGFRAVQSTPLYTSDDLLLGVVSTHFATVHDITPIELRIMHVYGTIAAEHAFHLLGHASLAEKAKEMNDALYASLFSRA